MQAVSSQVFDDLGCGRERYPPQLSEGAQRPTVFGTALVIFHRLAGAARANSTRRRVLIRDTVGLLPMGGGGPAVALNVQTSSSGQLVPPFRHVRLISATSALPDTHPSVQQDSAHTSWAKRELLG